MPERSKLFQDMTPLIGNPDTIRAARFYPGGEHLDQIFGPKPNPETGWYYPEAWLFSPAPAINLGSQRSDEGVTRLFDRDGDSCRWDEYAAILGQDLLGPYRLRLSVKLLDGSVTLPKEFHFREVDSDRLRNYPKIRSFTGSLTKPEVWIRHPVAEDEPGPSYVGFSRRLSPEILLSKIAEGPKSMEETMNSVLIDRGSSLFLPGGIVHSLGKGLYFEVLSDGDLKITLQDTFAGRRLTLEDRLDKLVTGNADDFRRALEFIDFDNWGESLINLCCKPPIAIDAYKKRIVHTEHFEAEWIEIAPADRYTIRNVDDPRPRIVIAVVGSCVLDGESDSFVLEANAGSFDDFAEKHSCYGAITHYSASHLHFFNQSNQKFIALHVCEPRNL